MDFIDLSAILSVNNKRLPQGSWTQVQGTGVILSPGHLAPFPGTTC